MDLSRREFLQGLGASVALAVVPAGFVRLASGLVVPEEEALEREAHRKIWQVAEATGVYLDCVGPGGQMKFTLADGREMTFEWKPVPTKWQGSDLYYGYSGYVALAATLNTPVG